MAETGKRGRAKGTPGKGRESLELRVSERTAELRSANQRLQAELAEQKRVEQTLRRELDAQKAISARKRTGSVGMARLRLLQFAATHSLDELLEATLNEAEGLTDSLIGFYHFVEADQKTLSLQNWSTRTKAEFCTARGKGFHYDVCAAGVWVDCIRQRQPVIHNDYAALPHRKGYPAGHATVVRELVVPVFRGDQIVAVLGVGNKPLDYLPEDVETVSLLADLAWDIAERKRAEAALRREVDVNKAMSELSRALISGDTSIQDVADRTLRYARSLTGSAQGLVSRIDARTGDAVACLPTSIMATQRWPSTEGGRIVFPLGPDGRYAELWGHALNTRRAFYTNSPGAHEASAGTPAAHMPLRNFLAVPSLVKDRLVGEVALADADRDFTDEDLAVVERLSSLYAMAVERSETEDRLRDSERATSELLGRLTEAQYVAMIGSWEWDLQTNRVWWSEETYRIFGVTPQNFVPSFEANAQFIHPDDRARYRTSFEHSVQTGEPLDLDLRLVTGEGRLKHCQSRGKVVYDDSGHPTRFVGTTMDITERKRAEEELRLSEKRYRMAQAIGHVGNWEYNLQTTEFWGSDEAKRIYGFDPARASFTTEEVESCVPERERVHQALVALIETGKPYNLEFEIHPRNSCEPRVIASIAELRRDERGAPLTVMGVIQDITERKRAEDEIRTLNRELEQRVRVRTAQLEAANKELESFAYSVSHDLRAPLRHVDGFVELLEKRTATLLDPQSRHYMDAISQSAKRMGTLIDDLLAFSRMGRQEMLAMPFDLGVLVEEVVRQVEPEARGRGIRWHIGELPVVTGDPALLRQVLVNLVSNAVKFTRPCEHAEISVGCLPGRENETVVFVRDNGVGFDAKYAQKLFGVFQRLHGADDFEGTGIGLANVRRIVSRHGGNTWAEGAVNAGATFYFSLPQALRGS